MVGRAPPTLVTSIDAAAQTVLERCGQPPRVAFLLGTGHAALGEHLHDKVVIAPRELPGGVRFGGDAPLLAGRLAGLPVVLTGPSQPYCEGATAEELALPVRVLRRLGADVLVLTAGVASLVEALAPGALAVLEDHVDASATHILRRPNDPALGPRFLDQTEPYAAHLRTLAQDAARARGLACPPAVLAAVPGPALPTRAEARLLRLCGVDLVGMSLVPDAIVARHAGFAVLALTVVTQRLDTPASVPSMLAAAERALPALHDVLLGVAGLLAKGTSA